MTEQADFVVDSAVDYVSDALAPALSGLSEAQTIVAVNRIRRALAEFSPFRGEPVDYVEWVKSERVTANDYNPNAVAPPEMKLLRKSIMSDGYTQPIVAMPSGDDYVVIDGFHRNRVGKECKDVRERLRGYLPVVAIRSDRVERKDRIAATIRHNRARGKHLIKGMSDIVVELKRRNWSNDRIGSELGMEPDEVLRLCQITGLADLFTDQEFSKSWDVDGEVTEADFEELTDDVSTYDEEVTNVRTVNTSDEERIFHVHDKWECHKAGFYANTKEGMTKAECEESYREFLSDTARFSAALESITGAKSRSAWVHSCEHYLTNAAMNRIAWLGQAAACYALGIPAVFRGGFFLLTEAEQAEANETALTYLNKWLEANGRGTVTMDEAYSGRQSDIY